jgi:PAS domain S-box-containing protein
MSPDGLFRLSGGDGSAPMMIRLDARTNAWIVTDRLGYVVDLTPAAAELFGLTDRQLMFHELTTLFDDPLPRTLLERLMPGQSLSHAVGIRRADGAVAPMNVEITHVEEWERGAYRWHFAAPPG